MVAAPVTNYISLDERGIAYIAGSRLKVRHIVEVKNDGDLTPEQIQEEYDFLSMAQIYSALSYYADHKEELDAEIERVEREIERRRRENPNPMTREDFEKRLREHSKA